MPKKFYLLALGMAALIMAGAQTSVPVLFNPKFVVYSYEGWRLVIDPVTNFVQHLGH